MFVAMIASECAPVAKVGGLGDMVFGLARELEIRGNAVEIILPKYDCMRYDQVWSLQPTYENLCVPWDGDVDRKFKRCFFAPGRSGGANVAADARKSCKSLPVDGQWAPKDRRNRP